jgi:methionine-rich copper-binding protein CopC
MSVAARLSGAALIAVALFAAVFSASGASAHARYISSTPSDGETVTESPAQIEVVFNQELSRSEGLPTMVVTNDAGDVIAEGAVLNESDRTRIAVEVPPLLPDGRYTVIWHNISDEDGDEAQGAFHFFIGGAAASATPVPSGDLDQTPTPAPTTVISGGGGDDGSGIPLWALVAGVASGIFVGGALGVSYAARRQM